MIAVIDYGMGNLESVSKALRSLGHDAAITSDAGDIAGSKAVVLPGVGAFPDCMRNLRELGLTDVVREVALKKPFLGICLGLQLLFEESDEFGSVKGLGIFPGRVKKFSLTMTENGERLKIPHMGWNSIRKIQATPYLDGIPDGAYFYFVHSFYVETDDSLAATKTHYGIEYVSSIARGDLFACQFHPEKSQKAGLKILDNFGKLAKGRG